MAYNKSRSSALHHLTSKKWEHDIIIPLYKKVLPYYHVYSTVPTLLRRLYPAYSILSTLSCLLYLAYPVNSTLPTLPCPHYPAYSTLPTLSTLSCLLYPAYSTYPTMSTLPVPYNLQWTLWFQYSSSSYSSNLSPSPRQISLNKVEPIKGINT